VIGFAARFAKVFMRWLRRQFPRMGRSGLTRGLDEQMAAEADAVV